ncbi:MAG TPA: type II secretion system protein GspN, partial [Anaeromyxobacter sp.]
DGRVRGHADVSGDGQQRLVADVAGVDLGAALPLRKATGLDLLGKVTGTADLTLPAEGVQRASGRVDLQLAEAGVAGGQLPVPGMSGGLPLPKIGLGQVTAAVKVGDGRATFEKLEAKGGDAELQTDGLSFVVQQRMEFAPLNGLAKLKVRDAFWSRGGTQSFKTLADVALASARGADGAWSFTVSGSVGHPRMQPMAGAAR